MHGCGDILGRSLASAHSASFVGHALQLQLFVTNPLQTPLVDRALVLLHPGEDDTQAEIQDDDHAAESKSGSEAEGADVGIFAAGSDLLCVTELMLYCIIRRYDPFPVAGVCGPLGSADQQRLHESHYG